VRPGDLVVLRYKRDGLPFQAALYANDPHTPPHFRNAWIQPGEVFLVVGSTTFHGLGGAAKWLQVVGNAGGGWVQPHGFEVIGETR